MENLIALTAASAILVLIPGPNVALIVANSLRYGLRAGMTTVLGTTAGVAVQLAIVVLGMAAAIELAADALSWIKWAGVVTLLWLGIRTWREPASDLSAIVAVPALFCRSCLVAAVNPKTLLFNAAFLPQFVANGPETTGQLVLVATVFLAVLWSGDMLWAVFAASARRLLCRYAPLRKHISGSFLVAAGVGLALTRRST